MHEFSLQEAQSGGGLEGEGGCVDLCVEIEGVLGVGRSLNTFLEQ